METLFENKSKIDMNEVLTIQNKIIKKTSLIISSIMFVILLGTGIGLYFVSSYLGISLIVAGFMGAFIVFPYVIKKSKQNSDIESFVVEYKFYENEFTCGNEKYSYSEIQKIYLFDKYIYIFTSPKESVVMTKQGMTKGVIADLFELFKNKKIKIEYKK